MVLSLEGGRAAGWVWEAMWHAGASSNQDRCRMQVSETLLFRSGRLYRWLFTSHKTGEVLKKSRDKMELGIARKHFTKLAAAQYANFKALSAADDDDGGGGGGGGQFGGGRGQQIAMGVFQDGHTEVVTIGDWGSVVSCPDLIALVSHVESKGGTGAGFRNTYKIRDDKIRGSVAITSTQRIVPSFAGGFQNDSSAAAASSSSASTSRTISMALVPSRSTGINQLLDTRTRELVRAIERSRGVRITRLQVDYTMEEPLAAQLPDGSVAAAHGSGGEAKGIGKIWFRRAQSLTIEASSPSPTTTSSSVNRKNSSSSADRAADGVGSDGGGGGGGEEDAEKAAAALLRVNKRNKPNHMLRKRLRRDYRQSLSLDHLAPGSAAAGALATATHSTEIAGFEIDTAGKLKRRSKKKRARDLAEASGLGSSSRFLEGHGQSVRAGACVGDFCGYASGEERDRLRNEVWQRREDQPWRKGDAKAQEERNKAQMMEQFLEAEKALKDGKGGVNGPAPSLDSPLLADERMEDPPPRGRGTMTIARKSLILARSEGASDMCKPPEMIRWWNRFAEWRRRHGSNFAAVAGDRATPAEGRIATGDPGIVVTVPSSSTSWVAPCMVELRWASEHVGADMISLALYKRSRLSMIIRTHAPNTGKLNWKVPAEFDRTGLSRKPCRTPQPVWRVKIFASDRPNIAAFSEEFTLVTDAAAVDMMDADVDTNLDMLAMPIAMTDEEKDRETERIRTWKQERERTVVATQDGVMGQDVGFGFGGGGGGGLGGNGHSQAAKQPNAYYREVTVCAACYRCYTVLNNAREDIQSGRAPSWERARLRRDREERLLEDAERDEAEKNRNSVSGVSPVRKYVSPKRLAVMARKEKNKKRNVTHSIMDELTSLLDFVPGEMLPTEEDLAARKAFQSSAPYFSGSVIDDDEDIELSPQTSKVARQSRKRHVGKAAAKQTATASRLAVPRRGRKQDDKDAVASKVPRKKKKARKKQLEVATELKWKHRADSVRRLVQGEGGARAWEDAAQNVGVSLSPQQVTGSSSILQPPASDTGGELERVAKALRDSAAQPLSMANIDKERDTQKALRAQAQILGGVSSKRAGERSGVSVPSVDPASSALGSVSSGAAAWGVGGSWWGPKESADGGKVSMAVDESIAGPSPLRPELPEMDPQHAALLSNHRRLKAEERLQRKHWERNIHGEGGDPGKRPVVGNDLRALNFGAVGEKDYDPQDMRHRDAEHMVRKARHKERLAKRDRARRRKERRRDKERKKDPNYWDRMLHPWQREHINDLRTNHAVEGQAGEMANAIVRAKANAEYQHEERQAMAAAQHPRQTERLAAEQQLQDAYGRPAGRHRKVRRHKKAMRDLAAQGLYPSEDEAEIAITGGQIVANSSPAGARESGPYYVKATGDDENGGGLVGRVAAEWEKIKTGRAIEERVEQERSERARAALAEANEAAERDAEAKASALRDVAGWCRRSLEATKRRLYHDNILLVAGTPAFEAWKASVTDGRRLVQHQQLERTLGAAEAKLWAVENELSMGVHGAAQPTNQGLPAGRPTSARSLERDFGTLLEAINLAAAALRDPLPPKKVTLADTIAAGTAATDGEATESTLTLQGNRLVAAEPVDSGPVMCSACDVLAAARRCEDCRVSFCAACFMRAHRRGDSRGHKFTLVGLAAATMASVVQEADRQYMLSQGPSNCLLPDDDESEEEEEAEYEQSLPTAATPSPAREPGDDTVGVQGDSGEDDDGGDDAQAETRENADAEKNADAEENTYAEENADRVPSPADFMPADLPGGVGEEVGLGGVLTSRANAASQSAAADAAAATKIAEEASRRESSMSSATKVLNAVKSAVGLGQTMGHDKAPVTDRTPRSDPRRRKRGNTIFEGASAADLANAAIDAVRPASTPKSGATSDAASSDSRPASTGGANEVVLPDSVLAQGRVMATRPAAQKSADEQRESARRKHGVPKPKPFLQVELDASEDASSEDEGGALSSPSTPGSRLSPSSEMSPQAVAAAASADAALKYMMSRSGDGSNDSETEEEEEEEGVGAVKDQAQVERKLVSESRTETQKPPPPSPPPPRRIREEIEAATKVVEAKKPTASSLAAVRKAKLQKKREQLQKLKAEKAAKEEKARAEEEYDPDQQMAAVRATHEQEQLRLEATLHTEKRRQEEMLRARIAEKKKARVSQLSRAGASEAERESALAALDTEEELERKKLELWMVTARESAMSDLRGQLEHIHGERQRQRTQLHERVRQRRRSRQESQIKIPVDAIIASSAVDGGGGNDSEVEEVDEEGGIADASSSSSSSSRVDETAMEVLVEERLAQMTFTDPAAAPASEVD